MKPYFRLLTACLLAAPLAAPLAAAVAGPDTFVDPLDQPAAVSPLASHALVNGLALAGARAVAVGQRGHVLYSDDAGASWRQASVPVSSDLVAVTFADARAGWAVGHDSVILHSLDGGLSWQRQFDGRADAKAGDKPLLDIRVDGAGHGLAVGAFGLALCSDDGGAHWRHCEDIIDNPRGLHLNAIRAIGDTLYIVGEQGLVLRRAAGAARFTAIATPYQGSYFGIAGDAHTLLVFGLRGTALRSIDNGASWQRATTGVQTGLADGMLLGDGTLLLVSQAGHLLRSTDGGMQFAPLAGVTAGAASAALALAPGRLLIGGARGLRVQAITLH